MGSQWLAKRTRDRAAAGMDKRIKELQDKYNNKEGDKK